MECLIIFENTKDLSKAERALQYADIDFTIIPLPSQLTADYDRCVKLALDKLKETIQILKENSVDNINLYKTWNEDGSSIYRQIHIDSI